MLVPSDLSPLAAEALEYATCLAEKVKANITSLHVDESQEPADLREDAFRLDILESAWETLGFRRSIDPSIQHAAVIKRGRMHEQLLETVGEEHIDLIVMGTSGGSGHTLFNRFFPSSNANRITRISPVPVLSLRAMPEPFRLNEILLPLDLTQQTSRKIRFALNLARLFSSRINLVAVSDYLENLRGKTSALEQVMDEQARVIREAGIEVTTEVIRHDDVAHSVVEYADEIQADLIVIVTAQENKLDSLLMGTRASRVIHNARRPVLSLRPRSLEDMFQTD